MDTSNKMEVEKEATTQTVDAEALINKVPDYRIADMRHQLSLADSICDAKKKKEISGTLMSRIKEEGLSHFYEDLCAIPSIGWKVDQSLLDSLKAKNAEDEKKIDAKISDAGENFGEAEIRDAHMEKAGFYGRIGDKKNMLSQLEVCHSRALGHGSRLEAILGLTRVGFFYGDSTLVCKNLHRAEQELERGGDWERRNRQKVYKGIHLMTIRNFQAAATLLTEALATFTATELLSYDSLVFYVVIVGMLAMERSTLKEKVVTSPEVLQVIENNVDLKHFLLNFYNCSYQGMMESLVPLSKQIQSDRYLSGHFRYIIRAFRLKAFAQFLNPFKSVTVSSMAKAFGVGEEFIIHEVSSFVAGGKLACKIDKVAGVISSNQPDPRNRLYQDIIKNGDLLLNRIQKLSRVIDI